MKRRPQWGQSVFTLRRQLWLVVKHYWTMRHVRWTTCYYAIDDPPKDPAILGRREFKSRFWRDIWSGLRDWWLFTPVIPVVPPNGFCQASAPLPSENESRGWYYDGHHWQRIPGMWEQVKGEWRLLPREPNERNI